MSKKNILILLSSVSGGGAQSLVLGQIKYYNQLLFNLNIISLRSGNNYEQFKLIGKNKYVSLESKSRFSIHTYLKLFNFIRKNSIDIIHTHLIEADIYGFLLKLLNPKIRLISTRHGENKFRQSIQSGLMNFSISLLNKRIICVSNSLKRYIRRYEFIPSRKLELIYNGIDVNYFKKEDHSKLRREFETNENNKEILIGIVGRLKKLKGHEYLFKAIKLLKEDHINNIKVLVLGEGSHLQKLINLRNKLDLEKEIQFIGFKNNTKDFYNIFDILCLPSNYEGLPLVLIEAMACETLVLSSNIPNNLEVVEDGIDGLVFKKSNVKDLERQIKLIMNDQYDIGKIKKNAREKVIKQFNLEKMIKEWEALYL